MNDFLQTIEKSINIKKRLVNLESEVNDAISLLYKTLKRRNKVLICGNGGSAADAQHLAAEFLVRLRPKVNRRPYPVISLAQDTSTITACGNDLGFENIFQRNFEALASKDDVLVIFSTSGNSKNILKVLKYAKKRKISSIAFLGNNGGKSKKLGKIEIIVPEKNTARIQESHIFLGHFIFEQVENLLTRNDKN